MNIDDTIKEILSSGSILLIALWTADKKILDKKFATEKGGPFHYDSAATYLCKYLAVYTNCNVNDIDKLFKRSALHNEKWDNNEAHRFRMIARGILKSKQK